MRRKSVFVSKSILVLMSLVSVVSLTAEAAGPPNTISLPGPTPIKGGLGAGAFDLLKDQANKIEEENTLNGWAYIISGGVAVAVSIPAYFLTEDVFARSVYSLGETLGVASVGYGSYLATVKDDATRFVKILSRTALTGKQRDELAYRFLEENAHRARAVRRIRVITHSLTAGLNLLNGFTTSSRELKSALFFLGGINVLASIHYFFSESEEEKFLQRVASERVDLILVPTASPMLALRFQF